LGDCFVFSWHAAFSPRKARAQLHHAGQANAHPQNHAQALTAMLPRFMAVGMNWELTV